MSSKLENAIRVLSMQPVKSPVVQRKPQVQLTVTVKDRFGNLSPATLMIPGETPACEIGQAIIEAVKVQTVNDGTGIVKATIGTEEVYNV